MNVVMPTAMVTMHQDPELAEQSKMTAARGARVLAAISGMDKVKDNCKAILSVATGNGEADATLVEYWTDFFEKWGYKEQQSKDIADAIESILA